ncbi:MAG TPA: hypothetical protein VEC12_10475, partial [Bacteroidia bacterium]|nr:hypothetical protein [Bacteroidia bacterium]
MKEILSLKLEGGRQLLAKEKAANPSNTLVFLGEDYIDFFTIMINENKAEYEKLLAARGERIKALEKGDKTSPWYNYALAELYVHWSTNRIRFGDYFKAATEIREAYKLLEANIEKHPDFLPNKKTMGMLETIVGTIPGSYQWMASIAGLEGNIDEGLKKIEAVINSKSSLNYVEQLKQEAIFVYAYLEIFVLKKPLDAWKLVEKNTTDYKTNLLNAYLRANIAVKCKKTDIAIETLKNRPRGKDYINFYYLDYLLGLAKLFRGDNDADIYFKIYVSLHTGENLKKSAYIRLSWFYFLKNDTKNSETYRGMVSRYGAENLEDDKNAQKEAVSGKKHDEAILKGRLYFDGGYYDKALAALNTKTADSYTNNEQKLEYKYRKARVLHESGKTDDAIKLYTDVMESGKDESYYYSAYSCLM